MCGRRRMYKSLERLWAERKSVERKTSAKLTQTYTHVFLIANCWDAIRRSHLTEHLTGMSSAIVASSTAGQYLAIFCPSVPASHGKGVLWKRYRTRRMSYIAVTWLAVKPSGIDRSTNRPVRRWTAVECRNIHNGCSEVVLRAWSRDLMR